MTHDEFTRLHLIQDYLDGMLTGKALRDFHDFQQNDPDFKQDVILLKKIHQAFSPENDEVFALRNILAEIESENKIRHFAKKRWRRIQWILLGAGIVILLVSLLYCYLQKSPQPNAPFIEYVA